MTTKVNCEKYCPRYKTCKVRRICEKYDPHAEQCTGGPKVTDSEYNEYIENGGQYVW